MSIAVKIYTLSTCSHCSCAKKLLDGSGVEYRCTEVDTLPKDKVSEVLDEVKRYNARCSFPTLIIGDKVIVGYRENEIKEALGI